MPPEDEQPDRDWKIKTGLACRNVAQLAQWPSLRSAAQAALGVFSPRADGELQLH